jgi:hypothetical protein
VTKLRLLALKEVLKVVKIEDSVVEVVVEVDEDEAVDVVVVDEDDEVVVTQTSNPGSP